MVSRPREDATIARIEAVDGLDTFAHVVVSPHLDDAVLSLGATIATWVFRGERVAVVTVCAGAPDGPARGAIAEALTGPRAPTEYVARRRREDADACATLGATAVWLDRLDAIYRRPERYATSFDALFGPRAADDDLAADARALVSAIAARAPSAQVWAPLGVGGHVDHVAIADGALDALCDAALAARVTFYEELPYAARAGAVARRLAELERARRPHLAAAPSFAPSDEALTLKLRACARYTSQLPGLFDDEASMLAVLRDHGERGWHARPLELQRSR